MPIYIYQCPECGHEEDHLHSMKDCNDAPENPWNKMECPKCKKGETAEVKRETKKHASTPLRMKKKVSRKTKKPEKDIILRRLIGGVHINIMGTGQKEYFKNDNNHPDTVDL